MGQNHWISGGVRSGKTSALVNFARQWWQSEGATQSPEISVGRSVLLFAMNADNRSQVTQRMLVATDGTLPLRSTTPLGFFEDEVILFWPLVIEQLPKATQLPLRLRPEAEQYLAVQFWGVERLESLNAIERFSTERWARNLLDLIQLAAFAEVPLESAAACVQNHWTDLTLPQSLWSQMRQMLVEWRDWCLAQGFLTYGLVSELYWRYLLPLPTYQMQLKTRYQLILVDDVESYPAIARRLFEDCAHGGLECCFTANPEFSVRLGLGADPEYLLGLQQSLSCDVTSLPPSMFGVGASLWPKMSARLEGQRPELNEPSLQLIKTMTRSQLLRQVAESVIELVQSQQVDPADIAILGPGLDSLARYALIEMIESQGIPVLSLKEQRPLISSALVRSLLTLLAFIYDGLGRFIDQDGVAEMLVVMTAEPGDRESDGNEDILFAHNLIDPVRAGYLADYCFKPDFDQPELLPLEVFPRWDRVGSQGAIAYRTLRDWVQTRRQTMQHQSFSLTDTLSQAIAFFWSKNSFRYDQSAVLRELLESAQHFEEIAIRQGTEPQQTLHAFITTLQQGTMMANPYPVNQQSLGFSGVTLATAYQYRIARLSHPYHFWLDIGSVLWQQGSLIKLWEAFAFLQLRPEQETNSAVEQEEIALQFQVKELSYRVGQSIFFCHSSLSVSGQEQMGTLISLVDEP